MTNSSVKCSILGIFVPLTPDNMVGDNAHDPNHPQKNTYTISNHKSNSMSFQEA